MSILRNQAFEGTLTAISWDRSERANKLSLYTYDDEDIILDHKSRIDKFYPFMNKKVRIVGDITSSHRDGRRVAIKKISDLRHDHTESSKQLARDRHDRVGA